LRDLQFLDSRKSPILLQSTKLDISRSLPEDPAGLRAFTALFLAEVKARAMLIAKLQHQLAGHRAHRFGFVGKSIPRIDF